MPISQGQQANINGKALEVHVSQILTDLGLIGLIVILILFSIILYRSLIKMKFIYGNYLSPFFFIFVAEIF